MADGGADRPLDVSERAELERLRKENADLRLDRSFLKKAAARSRGLLRLRSEPVEMFRLIEAEKTNFTITRMIALLKVSRSGWYKWAAAQAAEPSPTAVRRAGLDAKVAQFHHVSDQVYGSPRILADLRDDGKTVSQKTVAASMRRQRLQGSACASSPRPTTVADRRRLNPADLVDRNGTPAS